jgi:predicted DNA-binding protein
MARPPLPIEIRKTEKLSINITKEMNDRIASVSKKTYRPKASIVVKALELYFAQLDANTDVR